MDTISGYCHMVDCYDTVIFFRMVSTVWLIPLSNINISIMWYLTIVSVHHITVHCTVLNMYCSVVKCHNFIFFTNIRLGDVLPPDDLWLVQSVIMKYLLTIPAYLPYVQSLNGSLLCNILFVSYLCQLCLLLDTVSRRCPTVVMYRWVYIFNFS